MIKKQIDPGPFIGDVVAAHSAPKGVMTEKLTSIKSIQKITDTKKTIRNALSANETIMSVLGDMRNEFALPNVVKISANLKSEIQTRIRSEFINSFEIGSVIEFTQEITQEFKCHLTAESTQEVFSVKTYKKSAYELWLGFIDYLFVDYKTTLLGLRKKRIKFPPPLQGIKPTNSMVIKQQLARLEFWELLSDQLYLIDKDKYKNEINDAKEIIISEIQHCAPPYMSFGEAPNLYQISNIAFPLKWYLIDGKINGEYLKRIEIEEAEQNGTAWWFQYGLKKCNSNNAQSEIK